MSNQAAAPVKYGIKETLDVPALGEKLALAITDAKADGHVNVWDAPSFISVVPAAIAAVEKSEQIPLELKDLDGDEAKLVATAALNALKSLMNAVMKKTAVK